MENIKIQGVRTKECGWIYLSPEKQEDYRRELRRALFMWVEDRLYDSRRLLDVIAAIQYKESMLYEGKQLQMDAFIPSSYEKYLMSHKEYLEANAAEQDWAEGEHIKKYGLGAA